MASATSDTPYHAGSVVTGFGMPVMQSGPRVTSTQFVATIHATTVKASVPTANACSVRRKSGTPATAASAPATSTAAATSARNGQPARVARMADVYAPAPKNAG